MHDAIDQYFREVLARPPELILEEINHQRLKGRFHIALDLIQKFKLSHGENIDIAVLEKSLIKDTEDQPRHLNYWISNNNDSNLYPKGILSSREGLASTISIQKSFISGIKALMNDAVSFACEISIIARDDYDAYLVLRDILSAEIYDLDVNKYENHLAIDLICENYDKNKDAGYSKLFALLQTINPWQIARILRPQRLQKNFSLIQQLTDEIIERQVSAENLNDLQKTNLLVMAYSVVSHGKYRNLCDVLADKIQDRDQSTFTSWKRTWGMASMGGRQPLYNDQPVVNRKRKLNIAVCVSGQLRGFKDAKRTWERLGLDSHNVDYYVHTWKNVGVRFPDPSWRPHVERRFSDKNFIDSYIKICAQYGIETVTELYPSIFSTSSGDFIATDASIKEVYGSACVAVIDDELDERFRAFSNQDKMYYKILECFKLAERSDKEYDLIIRIRPDLKINEGTEVDWYSVYEKSLRENIVYSEAPSLLKENISVGDQFGAACYKVAKKYASTFNFHDSSKETKLPGVPLVRSGHATLAWSLLCQGVRNEQLKQIKWGGLSDIQKLNKLQIRELIEKDIGAKGANVIHQEFLSSLGN